MQLIRRKAAPDPSDRMRDIEANLKSHGIGMVIPAGAIMKGNLQLACGVLILGYYAGSIVSSRGSVIIGAGAHFLGRIEAHTIVVEGKVGDASKAPKDSASLEARHRVAISIYAEIQAVIQAPRLHSPDGANLHQSVFKVINPANRRAA